MFVGMLLRMFVLLYDTEVVEEEAFLRWKEDVSEKHPGKGKALFQVPHPAEFITSSNLRFNLESVLL